MKKSVLLSTTLLALCISNAAISYQSQPSTPPPACKTDEAFKAFDFWIGDWNVVTASNGQFAGTNSISVIEGGCALLEQWKGGSGSTGISTNHYNPVTGKWRQLWLSAGAYSIDYEGGILDGSMVMEGEIYYYNQKTKFPFRGTWTPREDGSVRQHFEQFNPKTEKWATWFDGIYTRETATQ